MTGVADMILDFETYLKNRWMRSAYYFQGKDHRALLHDTQGSVATIDTYLAMGRQRPAVSRMIDSFINLQSLNEIIYETPKDLEKLGKHRGEVILTGAWDLHQQGKNIQ